MLSPEKVQALIENALPEAQVKVVDLTGTNDHFQVQVVSPAFAGVSRIKRHRMVYDALGDAMQGAVHALALKTQTPDEAS